MTYQQVSDYICGIPRFKEVANIQYSRELLDELGVDDRDFQIIHVAGTNGKGSTCCYLEHMLLAAGHKTAAFTSPHLVTIRERIRVDGDSISEEAFVEAFEAVMKLTDKKLAQGEPHPTFFETLLLMCMWICRKEQVEYLVMECGMGGKFDTTNIIRRPAASVITTISYDHMKFLGNTIPEIASEKAGIIKENCPVVFLDEKPEVTEVIQRTAQKTCSKAYPVSAEDIRILINDGRTISFAVSEKPKQSYTLCTGACYQPMNAAVALKVMDVLGIGTEEEKSRGLRAAHWPARMDHVAPGIYIDGGHNPEGAQVFLKSRSILEQNGHIPAGQILVFAVANTKEYREMLEMICEVPWKKVLATQFHADKSVEARELGEAFREILTRHGQSSEIVEVISTPEDAYHRALELREDRDVIFIAGSLYLAGNLLGVMEKEKQA